MVNQLFCHHLPVSCLGHDSKSVLRILLQLNITDVSGGIILTFPARRGEVSISVVF